MEIQISSTDKLVHLDGVPVRVWEGVTADGTPCFVFVHRIAVRSGADCAEFERQLREQLPPLVLAPLPFILSGENPDDQSQDPGSPEAAEREVV